MNLRFKAWFVQQRMKWKTCRNPDWIWIEFSKNVSPAGFWCCAGPSRPADSDPQSPSHWPAAECTEIMKRKSRHTGVQTGGASLHEQQQWSHTSPFPSGTLMTTSSPAPAIGEPLTDMLYTFSLWRASLSPGVLGNLTDERHLKMLIWIQTPMWSDSTQCLLKLWIFSVTWGFTWGRSVAWWAACSPWLKTRGDFEQEWSKAFLWTCEQNKHGSSEEQTSGLLGGSWSCGVCPSPLDGVVLFADGERSGLLGGWRSFLWCFLLHHTH